MSEHPSAPVRGARNATAASDAGADATRFRLVKGDALQRSAIAAESVDLIVTSPPYNVGKEYSGDAAADTVGRDEYLQFTRQWLENCYEWTKPTGRICVNVSIDKNKNGKMPLSAYLTLIGLEVGWNYHATILWNEGNISRRTAWGSWKSASAPHVIAPVETIIVLYKGDVWKRERQGKNDISAEEFKEWVLGIWNFNGESAKRIGHQAPFPRELPKRCIKLFSFVGDTVLDPFAGSGTTMLEAYANKRRAVGVEIEWDYCRLTLERMQQECGLKSTKYSLENRGGAFLSVLESVNCYEKPHKFVDEAYSAYLAGYRSSPSVNGRVFEYIICETLKREGIVPFYYQAKFALVPNADFDIVCYHPRMPVALSAKVSLRERYKQADLEGIALRQVYRNARSYLLTLSDEQAGVRDKIRSGDVAGLTDCVRADSPDYDMLLDELKQTPFSLADAIEPLMGRAVA